MLASESERLLTTSAAAPTPSGFERYERLFVLGEGGMGIIEAALERGTGGFERVVALKRLLPSASKNARLREMFLREARLAALLNHPNVVHAYAAGEVDGECFLAMEYVEGEPLSRVLSTARERGAPLAPSLVAHLLADVCEGLHAAHELRDVTGSALNVVHRDVSPNNVMIAYEGHVKLLDFGVAKMELRTGSPLTKTGEIKGKLAYMSPEQAMGDAVDRRSDLFAVGAVLFEALVGSPMWGDGSEMDVMRRLALEEAPRLAGALPSVEPALAALHARLVARDPNDRPATAREVADVLHAVAGTGSTLADRNALRARMFELFEPDAGARRSRLSAALTAVAPTQVEQLRKSLSPPAPSPSEAHATAVDADSSTGAPATRAVRARWVAAGVVVAAVVAVGVGIGVVSARTDVAKGRDAAPGASEKAALVTPGTATPTVASAEPPAASPPATNAATPSPSASARAPSTPATTAPAARRAPRPTPSGSAPRPTPSGHPLDVDPTPF